MPTEDDYYSHMLSVMFATYPTLVIMRRFVLRGVEWRFQSARVAKTPT